jgi:hypothetical protein
VLLFELFPAFLALLSVIVGAVLLGKELKARHDREPIRKPAGRSTDAAPESDPDARPRRPSMER